MENAVNAPNFIVESKPENNVGTKDAGIKIKFKVLKFSPKCFFPKSAPTNAADAVGQNPYEKPQSSKPITPKTELSNAYPAQVRAVAVITMALVKY